MTEHDDGPEDVGTQPGAPAVMPDPAPAPPQDLPVPTRDELQAELALIKAEVTEQRAVRDAAVRRLAELQTEETRLIELLDPTSKEPQHVRSQHAIREYLKQQAEQRAKRAADRAAALGKLGGSPDALRGKAPIDAAHTRQTGYGHSRPKSPQLGS
ncbi:MAG TPA: hypothetical protein VFW95_08605 [Candidatus Limnocylindria bacterium]|nr:hypothetical protein [Candidatus Limnocylindria bacterium]